MWRFARGSRDYIATDTNEPVTSKQHHKAITPAHESHKNHQNYA